MPQRRRQSKLAGSHPAEPKPEETSQYERSDSVSSEDDGSSHDFAGARDPGARDPGAQNPGAQNPGAQNPEGGTRVSSSGRAEPETRLPEGERASTGRQVAWTDEAKKVRSELTAWAAARRKAAGRVSQARDAAGQVPTEELAVIVEKVAEATGEPVGEVRQAAGLAAEPDGR